MGLAPGMADLLALDGIQEMDIINDVKIRVGGLPLAGSKAYSNPLRYMLVFGIFGLINEYMGEALAIRDGKVVVIPTFGERESFEINGEQYEAFPTSGGTSTLTSGKFRGKVKNMDYMTIRYPGHAEIIKAFIEMGFFDEAKVSLKNKEARPSEFFSSLAKERKEETLFNKENIREAMEYLGILSNDPIQFNEASISPRQFFAQLAEKALNFPGEKDKVIIFVSVSGEKNGKPKTIEYYYDSSMTGEYGSQFSEMARTTGFPVSTTALMLARGQIKYVGAAGPEHFVPTGLLIEELRKKGVGIDKRVIDEAPTRKLASNETFSSDMLKEIADIREILVEDKGYSFDKLAPDRPDVYKKNIDRLKKIARRSDCSPKAYDRITGVLNETHEKYFNLTAYNSTLGTLTREDIKKLDNYIVSALKDISDQNLEEWLKDTVVLVTDKIRECFKYMKGKDTGQEMQSVTVEIYSFGINMWYYNTKKTPDSSIKIEEKTIFVGPAERKFIKAALSRRISRISFNFGATREDIEKKLLSAAGFGNYVHGMAGCKIPEETRKHIANELAKFMKVYTKDTQITIEDDREKLLLDKGIYSVKVDISSIAKHFGLPEDSLARLKEIFKEYEEGVKIDAASIAITALPTRVVDFIYMEKEVRILVKDVNSGYSWVKPGDEESIRKIKAIGFLNEITDPKTASILGKSL